MKKQSPKEIIDHSKQYLILLVVIFLIATVLRLYKLGSIMAGFHVDELNAGYIGRYIILHGKDILGNFIPLYFNKFGDFRPTGIFYLSGLSTFIFGVNEFATRFPSAVTGALSIFPLYGLFKKVTGNRNIGIIGAIILTISPWHIVLSRATSESIIGLFFFLTGLFLIFDAIEKNNIKPLLLGIVLLLSTYLFYHSFRLVVPLIVLGVMIFHQLSPLQRWLRATTILFFALTVLLAFSNVGTGRFSQVAFYKDPHLNTTVIDLLSGDRNTPLLLSRTFHNKPLEYGRTFIKQYMAYFSPDYLFLDGGYPDRYRVQEQGLFYLSLIPMLILGISSIFTKRYRLSSLFMMFFLAVAPIPAALTYEDSPNVQRSIILIIPVLFFIATGIDIFVSWIRQQKTVVLSGLAIFLVVLSYETGLFFHLYMTHASSYKSIYHNDGNHALFQDLKTLYPQVNSIKMPLYDELPMYTAFYMNIFDHFPTDTYTGSPDEEKIGKFIFVNTRCPLKQENEPPHEKRVYVTEENCPLPPEWVTQQATIYRSDSTIVYSVYITK